MSLKTLAYIFAGFFLAIGILGFIPGVTEQGRLLGIFDVSPLHNVIHILSGLAALGLTMTMGDKGSKLYFQVFGIVYGLVTVVGFIQGTTVLGLIGVNMADNLLHLFITAVALYAGFGMKPQQSM